MARKKMTEKEKQDWESLYVYVKSNIMGYDDNQALSSTMVLRLKGLLRTLKQAPIILMKLY